MAELSSPRRGSTPTLVPQKRPHGLDDEQHAPAVSSPLNPDFANARARKAVAPVREQREKKETLKKREAKGIDNARAGTPESQSHGRKTKKVVDASTSSHSLIRYSIPQPKPHDFNAPSPPTLVPGPIKAGRQFYETQEYVYNRKGFRYTHCIADPAFPFTQYHRQSEIEPFGPRFDYEDSSSHICFDEAGRAITTEKGFRMARANVGAREGRWFWECKVLSGVKNPHNPNVRDAEPGGHLRLGFSRREASLDTPVGFDAYSYGLRDVSGQKVHRSRPHDFFPTGESVCEGDVIGLEINLPSLALHRKVVEGTYNKAVDITDDPEAQTAEAPNVIRDRLPIRYKSQIYFEQFEYQPSKELEELLYPSASTTSSSAAAAQAPNPNHPVPALRTLPFSSIKIYKNGRLMGTPFTDLFAFLPPASKPATQSGAVGAREGLDDGMLGYFPSVSVFQGGAAEANFGPDFWFPPPSEGDVPADDDVDMIGEVLPPPSSITTGLNRSLRAFSERYVDQIAEDVVYDILDEVDMWMTDGGNLDLVARASNGAPPVLGPVDPTAPGLGEAVAEAVAAVGSRQASELNEIVQDEE